jgi:hypothetical protein
MANPDSYQLVKQLEEVQTSIDQLLNAPYGQQGAMVISDQRVYNGDWYCVVALTDNTELDATGTIVNWGLNGVLGMPLANDIPLIAGVPMYGDFTRIQLVAAACTVIAYNK